MRYAFFIPIALLAACSGDKPADDALVTLDETDGAAPVAAPGAEPSAQSGAIVQAVNAEGSKLEPILSSAISAAGMESGACRFSPAQGALPVLVTSETGGKAMISVAGQQIDVAPAAAVAATGGSFAGQGVSLSVVAGEAGPSGGKASMQVNDADGPAFTYQDGFWVCN